MSAMRWLLLPVALCAVSPAALAMDPSLRGFYIGGAVGDATVEFEDDQTGAAFDADDTGYKIIVGYRIIDWVAVEVNYSDYGNPVDNFFGVDLEASYDAKSVSVLGMLPLGNFDLFGRLGFSRLDADFRAVRFNVRDSDESTEPLFGLGAQFRPNANLAIRLEWDAVLLDASNNDDDDWDDFWDDDWDDDRDDGDWVSMLSLGVTYKF
jgi:opacity protein-like surface antigen